MSLSIPLVQREENEKRKFRDQLNSIDNAMKFLNTEVETLNRSQNEGLGSPRDVQNKKEYLMGGMECFKGVKKVFQCRDVAMDEEYEFLPAGPEKEELALDYLVMREYLSQIELNIYRILAAPIEWFSQQIYEVQKWITSNPKTAIAIVAGTCSSLAGALGFLSEFGIHLVYTMGLSPAALSVGASILTGGCVGFALGGLVVLGCNWALSGTTYRSVTADAQAKAKEIERMVNTLGGLPSREFRKQVEQCMKQHEKMEATMPSYEDQICLLCHGQGGEVKIPVKLATCQGQHFMCKAHFQQWHVDRRDLRCTVCRT